MGREETLRVSLMEAFKILYVNMYIYTYKLYFKVYIHVHIGREETLRVSLMEAFKIIQEQDGLIHCGKIHSYIYGYVCTNVHLYGINVCILNHSGAIWIDSLF
jgi:hypothetical protein